MIFLWAYFFEYNFFRWYGILVFKTVLVLNGCDRNRFFSMLNCYVKPVTNFTKTVI